MAAFRSSLPIAVAFIAGAASALAVGALAQAPEATPEVASSEHRYQVSAHELVQTLVLGDIVEGEYRRELILSDGSVQELQLRAVTVDGEPQVELLGNGMTDYLPPRSSFTRGRVLVSIKPIE